MRARRRDPTEEDSNGRAGRPPVNRGRRSLRTRRGSPLRAALDREAPGVTRRRAWSWSLSRAPGSSPLRAPARCSPRLRLLLLALAYTLLNAIKPLHIDDAAYYRYAAQAAKHPLDPYGFEIFWYQAPQP